MSELKHNFVATNGIRMHYVEQGTGPLVVLCHGWPESWYSYRHQIPALANAGFRVVAPDQRGYGQTDAPEPIESYGRRIGMRSCSPAVPETIARWIFSAAA